MTNPESNKARGAFHLQAAELREARGPGKRSLFHSSTLYTFLCKSGEHFILDTFVYITRGIDFQINSLCTRKDEIRAVQ